MNTHHDIGPIPRSRGRLEEGFIVHGSIFHIDHHSSWKYWYSTMESIKLASFKKVMIFLAPQSCSPARISNFLYATAHQFSRVGCNARGARGSHSYRDVKVRSHTNTGIAKAMNEITLGFSEWVRQTERGLHVSETKIWIY